MSTSLIQPLVCGLSQEGRRTLGSTVVGIALEIVVERQLNHGFCELEFGFGDGAGSDHREENKDGRRGPDRDLQHITLEPRLDLDVPLRFAAVGARERRGAQRLRLRRGRLRLWLWLGRRSSIDCSMSMSWQ
jgi:hypothetical protein